MDITLQVYTGIWENLESFDTAEEAFKRIDELRSIKGDIKGVYRLLFGEERLRSLPSKIMKSYEIPKDSVFIGSITRPYGDEYYYRLPDGSFGYEYFSIGD